MEELKGPFKDIIPLFQKYKKSLGYKHENLSNYYRLDNYLANNGIKNLDNSEKIFKIAVSSLENISFKENNYNCLKNLYEFMKILNYNDLYFEELYFEKKGKHIHYIMNEKQIITLFKSIDELSINLKNNNNCFPVFFRLLYSCGLRVSEAINLKLVDYNAKNGTILIVKSKNDITRLVPLSESMNKTMKKYNSIIKNNKREYFFEDKNSKLKYNTVKDFFDKVCVCIDVKLTMHSLRHNFCVHTIEKSHKENINSDYFISLLYIYMGHKNIESSIYYYRLTDNYYDEIFKKVKKNNDNIIPKVGDIYNE